MVRVYCDEITARLKASQPGKRMPLLCSVNRSLGWRIISENYEEHERGIRSEHFDLNKYGIKEDNLTAMAMFDGTGIIAIGSGGKDGNLYFILDMSAEKDIISGLRFKPIHKEVIGAPVHSLDWSGNHLLVGTVQGVTKLYKVSYDTNFEISCIGQYVNEISEMSIYAPLYVINSHVKSAEFAPNYSSVHTNNSDVSCQFLTTTMNQISVWDSLQESAPVQQYKANDSLNCASWSTNDPHSLIVCGGRDKKLTIIDTRISENDGVVWSVDRAHDRPIRDAKFNPFIPYWLASAGEDSIVNIWDLRSSYHGPVAKIDGMMGMVTSVTWSNIRPENIGTTSSGGTMRYWTLAPECLPIWDTFYRVADFDKQDTLPIIRDFEEENIWCTVDQRYKRRETKSWYTDVDEGVPRSTMMLVGALGLGEWGTPENGTRYKGEVIVSSKGAAVSVKPSKLRPSVYYCITSGGQLAAHTVRFDAAGNIRNRHRYDPKTKSAVAAQIEDDIYCRRITEAQLKLEILRTTPQSDEQSGRDREEEVTFLKDCLKVRKGIESTDWSFDSLPDRSSRRVSRRIWNREDIWNMSIHTFKTDLKYWSYRIPPGYNNRYNFPLDMQPIIAPYLLVEELEPKKITPIADDLRSIYSDITSVETPLKSNKEATRDENLLSAFPKATPVDITPVDVGATMITPIKDRRNVNHVPPIITTRHDDIQRNPFTPLFSATNGDPIVTPPILTPTPHTPPISAHTPHTPPILARTSPILTHTPSNVAHTPTWTNTNPFETSANPFAVPQDAPENIALPIGQPHSAQSTNPFETESIEDDHLSIHSATIGQIKNRRNSLVSAGHRLSLSLSRRSVPDKKHHLFNPLKILSRRSSTTEESKERPKERPKLFTAVKNGLKRDSSGRRNALHGPF